VTPALWGRAVASGAFEVRRRARYASRVITIDTMQEADVADVLPYASGTTEARFKEELARPWARLRVARLASDARADGAPADAGASPRGEPVGFLLAWIIPGEVHVLDVAVRPDARRRGLGRALLRDVIDDARARGATSMFLEVRRSNAPALALYRGLGFYAFNVRRAYYSDGEDAIEMALALDPATGAIVRRDDEVAVASP
jgi:[ribosomal protein S18]-alanine N-acetyltransferase